MTRKKKSKKEGAGLARLITVENLQDLVDPGTYELGIEYFSKGRVTTLLELNGRIKATVRGDRDHKVSLWAEGGKLAHGCTCASGVVDELCEHCVAAAMRWLEQARTNGPAAAPGMGDEDGAAGPGPGPSPFSSARSVGAKAVDVEDIRDMLFAMPREVLVDMVLYAAMDSEELMGKLVQTLEISNEGIKDPVMLKEVITRALAWNDFVDDDDVMSYIDAMGDLAEQIGNLLRDGKAREALDVSEHFLSTLASMSLDDNYYYFDLDDIREDMLAIHKKACLAVKPDSVKLARSLFSMQKEGGYHFIGSVPGEYGDILGKRGMGEYRRLIASSFSDLKGMFDHEDADEIGESAVSFMARLQTRELIGKAVPDLMRRDGGAGPIIEAVTGSIEDQPQYHALAEALLEAGYRDLAIEWAGKGIKKCPGGSFSPLFYFLVMELLAAEQFDAALEAAWEKLDRAPSEHSYKLLKRAATAAGRQRGTDEWPAWREKALDRIRRFIRDGRDGKVKGPRGATISDNEIIVELLLNEMDWETAFAEAKEGGCGIGHWKTLGMNLEKDRPGDAAEAYVNAIGGLVPRAGAKAYGDAIKLLKKIRVLVRDNKADLDLDAFVAGLREKHHRKAKFLKMLERAGF